MQSMYKQIPEATLRGHLNKWYLPVSDVGG